VIALSEEIFVSLQVVLTTSVLLGVIATLVAGIIWAITKVLSRSEEKKK